MKDLLERNVLVTCHRNDEEGLERIEERGIWLFPTFLALDSDGEELARWDGFSSTAEFVSLVEILMADPVTHAQRAERYVRFPTANDAIRLGGTHLARRELAEATRYFDRALEMSPTAARRGDVPMKRLYAVYRGVDDGSFDMDQATALTLDMVLDPGTPQKDVLWIGEWLLRRRDELGPASVDPLLRRVREVAREVEDPQLLERAAVFQVDYTLHVEGDAVAAFELRCGFAPGDWRRDPYELNSMAWWCFETGHDPEGAEALAARAIRISTSRAANALDTQAELRFARGDRVGAVESMEAALRLMPDYEYYKQQLERFRNE